jgi:hypothetical protein
MRRTDFINNPVKDMLGWWKGEPDAFNRDSYIYVSRKSLVGGFICDSYDCVVIDMKTGDARSQRLPESMITIGTTKCEMPPSFQPRLLIHDKTSNSTIPVENEDCLEYLDHTVKHIIFDAGRGKVMQTYTRYSRA